MKLSVAIIGRSEWMYETMIKLFDAGVKINYIITAKESPEFKYSSEDFKEFAFKNKIGFLHKPSITVDDILQLEKKYGKADIGVSVNYSGVIPEPVVNSFKLGVLNAHGGDLPRYRGNACQAWAIINQEEKVGLCIHSMIGGELDSGKIITRDYLSININTKIAEVYKWMGKQIPFLFHQAIEKLNKNANFFLEEQSTDPQKALRCYPRNPEDGKIDWKRTNEEIHRLINASSEPYSGAYCSLNDEKLIIWDSEIFYDDELYVGVPGQIASYYNDTSVVVLCGKGKLLLKEIEYKSERTRSLRQVFKSLRWRLK